MAITLTTIVSLLILFQIATSSPSPQWTNAINLQHNILDSSTKSIFNAIQNGLWPMLEEIESAFAAAVFEGSYKISNRTEQYVAQSKKIKRSAQNSETDVSACIEEYEKDIEALKTLATKNLEGCAQNLTQRGVEYIFQAVDGIIPFLSYKHYRYNENRILSKWNDVNALVDISQNILYVPQTLDGAIYKYLDSVKGTKLGYIDWIGRCVSNPTFVMDDKVDTYLAKLKSCMNSQ